MESVSDSTSTREVGLSVFLRRGHKAFTTTRTKEVTTSVLATDLSRDRLSDPAVLTT